jgi:SAM-dependent methyltransferase
LAELPAGANLGLGCGNPTAIANLQPGQVVVDLGSGAAIDVVLAAKKVGPAGRVIGVDMTPAMLARGWETLAAADLSNAELRLGQIEKLPIDDASADVVISNCVINLAPDKEAVFREVARVLRPGGKMAVSDIVLTGPLPDAIRTSVAAYIGCVAGAMLREDYLAAIERAGLTVTRAADAPYDMGPVLRAIEGGPEALAALPEDFDPANAILSLSVEAVKV